MNSFYVLCTLSVLLTMHIPSQHEPNKVRFCFRPMGNRPNVISSNGYEVINISYHINLLVECEPGYIGINCSSLCPSGYFGRLCSKSCRCSSGMYCEPTRGCMCNTTSVNCTESGILIYEHYKRYIYVTNHFKPSIMNP